ncbi:cysteine desulfurase family protein [Streptococcus halichoeri]|uniref:cysteine desulfurase family protein n=1 Tax=Streptococcus halichoeri TaxID=254785 RepID=UPI00135CC6AE|nr:cysteine desulfurase family protein [Streptococcus halichoeri]
MIYLDNAATTPMTESVITAINDYMMSSFGNPSSIHSYGRKAHKLLREARQTIADLLGVASRDLIFTAGGTESDNAAIKGYALAHQKQGRHLITTSIEHHAVLHTMAYLEEQFGFDITYLEPQKGTISVQQVEEALRPDTILVSMMAANNETGDLLPIYEVGQLLKNHQAVFHVDAVQIIGKAKINLADSGIDMLSASAHKFHGPKGVGFLYSHHLIWDPLLHGGDQEEKRRSGTENMIGIIGMAQALQDAYRQMEQNWEKVTALNSLLLDQLAGLPYYVNGSDKRLPHVLNLGFKGLVNGTILTQLDLAGIAISTGSACTAGTVDPSHVLAALYGPDSNRLRESIRISFSDLNTTKEVQILAHELKKIVKG